MSFESDESINEFLNNREEGKRYKVEIGSYKNSPVLTIWEYENGIKKDFPVISFGKKKAQAIMSALEEIKNFVG